MIEVLVAVNIVLVVGLPLLALYGKERLKNLARETTDKALADYKHSHDQILAQLNESHQRRVQESGLFAQRRNEVYAETYALFEKARGGFANHFGSLTGMPDLDRSTDPDLRFLVGKLDLISDSERAGFEVALDVRELEKARSIASELYERHSLRSAKRLFREFKAAWVVHALYFSPPVDSILAEASHELAIMTVFADDLIKEGKESDSINSRGNRAKTVADLERVSARLRAAMRTEMQPAVQAIQTQPTTE
jgi:hypothetical protein